MLAGLLVSVVSCTPIVRATIDAASGDPVGSDSSFLGALMLLAFACLCTLVGVFLVARPLIGLALAKTPAATRSALTWLHLSPLLVLLGLPMVHLLVPLWVARRFAARQPALAGQARALLNFQMTWTLFLVVALMLSVMVVGLLLVPLLLVFQVTVCLRAAWQAWHGRSIGYPLGVELIRTTPATAGD